MSPRLSLFSRASSPFFHAERKVPAPSAALPPVVFTNSSKASFKSGEREIISSTFLSPSPLAGLLMILLNDIKSLWLIRRRINARPSFTSSLS